MENKTDLTELFTTIQNLVPLSPGDGHAHVVLRGDPLSDLGLNKLIRIIFSIYSTYIYSHAKILKS